MLSDENYPRRELNTVGEQNGTEGGADYNMLSQLLPDADPSYLRVHYDRLADKPDSLKEFINNALEQKDYPTMEDYKRKQ